MNFQLIIPLYTDKIIVHTVAQKFTNYIYLSYQGIRSTSKSLIKNSWNYCITGIYTERGTKISQKIFNNSVIMSRYVTVSFMQNNFGIFDMIAS